MEKKSVNLWYDEEGDFLEITWNIKPGYFTETEDDRVMVNVDMEGQVQGFHILGISTIKGHPFEVSLAPGMPKNTPEEIEKWRQQTKERARRKQE